MTIHFCPLDKDCRSLGVVWRLHLTIRHTHVALALAPGSRFLNPDGSLSWYYRRPVERRTQ